MLSIEEHRMLQNKNRLIQASYQDNSLAPTALSVNHDNNRESNSSHGGRNFGRGGGRN